MLFGQGLENMSRGHKARRSFLATLAGSLAAAVAFMAGRSVRAEQQTVISSEQIVVDRVAARAVEAEEFMRSGRMELVGSAAELLVKDPVGNKSVKITPTSIEGVVLDVKFQPENLLIRDENVADDAAIAKYKISRVGTWPESDIPVLSPSKYPKAFLVDGSRPMTGTAWMMDVLPKFDDQFVLGNAAYRWKKVVASTGSFEVILNRNDANPVARLGDSGTGNPAGASLVFGPGGGTAPDTKIYRDGGPLVYSVGASDKHRFQTEQSDTGAKVFIDANGDINATNDYSAVNVGHNDDYTQVRLASVGVSSPGVPYKLLASTRTGTAGASAPRDLVFALIDEPTPETREVARMKWDGGASTNQYLEVRADMLPDGTERYFLGDENSGRTFAKVVTGSE